MGGALSYDITGLIYPNNQFIYNLVVLPLVSYGTFSSPINTCFRNGYNPIVSWMRGYTDPSIIQDETINNYTDRILGQLMDQEDRLNELQDKIENIYTNYVNYAKSADKISKSAYINIQSSYKYAPNMYGCYLKYNNNWSATLNNGFSTVWNCYFPKLVNDIFYLRIALYNECFALSSALTPIWLGISSCTLKTTTQDKRNCILNLVSFFGFLSDFKIFKTPEFFLKSRTFF